MSHRPAGRRPLLVLVLVTAFCVACGDDGATDQPAGVDASVGPDGQLLDDGATLADGAGGDVSGDAALDDAPEDGGEATDAVDAVADDAAADTGPSCPGGDGCMCTFNGDCYGGLCADTSEGKLCLAKCIENCAQDGYSCFLWSGPGADMESFCAPTWGFICNPCTESYPCTTKVGKEAACVQHGNAGAFCGPKCSKDAECPTGHGCTDLPTVEGKTAKVCAPLSPSGKGVGACKCSKMAVNQSLSTTCTKVLKGSDGSVLATCKGQRTCGKTGLTDCNAPTPGFETCDGVDNDCDGDTDEGTCDDDNPCTMDACAGAAGCSYNKLNAGDCDADGNPCTVGDSCKNGVCVKGTGTCDDGNACTKDVCDPAKGCTATDDDGATCDDDGDPCTLAGKCIGGGCQPGAKKNCDDANGCTIDSCDAKTGNCLHKNDEGAPCTDGNKCTGADACKDGKCNPGSPKLCEGGPTCNWGSCDPSTGKCAWKVQQDGLPCDDGIGCTKADVCKGGSCSGSVLVCNDGDPCTIDFCDPKQGQCKTEAAQGGCDDKDACTGPDLCKQGACVGLAKSATVCNDGNPCTADSCDKALGCVNVPNSASCDDGNSCTKGDTCKGGKCVGSQTICECVQDGDCAAKDDGNACNGVLFCDKSKQPFACKKKAFSEVKCDASGNSACLENQCVPKTGKCLFVAVKQGQVCSDNNACTAGETCQGGKCTGGVGKTCDDKNACTADSCDIAKGCVFLAKTGAKCDDGKPCTVADKCVLIKAAAVCAGAAKNCSDGNACTKDVCNSKTGECGHVNYKLNTPCNDGNQCTLSDVCKSGKAGLYCAAGKLKNCNDGNVCSSDGCNSKTGACAYSYAKVGTKCNDNKICTVSDSCQKAKVGTACTGKLKNCSDGNPCSIDSCVAVNGACVHVATTDGTPCAKGKQCSGGACLKKAPVPPSTMVTIKSAGFRMGCHAQVDNQCNAGTEKPHHDVILSTYYIDKYEVSSGNYKKCVAAKKCPAPIFTNGKGLSTYYTTTTKYDKRPVNFVRYGYAEAYCKWVGSRLCTEAEWEYAARTKSGYKYPWGNKEPTCSYANFYDAPKKKYCFVEKRPGNIDGWPAGKSKFGVYNMAGNVAEWIGDRWGSKTYYDTPIRDPQGPDKGGSRMYRGGSYKSSQANLRTSARFSGSTSTYSAGIGFRCCRSAFVKPQSCVGVVGYCDDGQLCTTDVCDKGTGECLHIAIADNTPCAKGKRCDTGKCIALAPINRVKIGASSHKQGCNAAMDNQCSNNERPHHEVKLSAYYIDRYPVQSWEYKVCYEAGKCTIPSAGDGKSLSTFDSFLPVNKQKHPINWVHRSQAEKYCAWAGARLCTEAEWEFAARGPKGYKYPWGNKEPNCAHANFMYNNKYCAVSKATMSVLAHPAGKSVMGVYEMAGNVWEMLDDRWGAYNWTYPILDPPGPDKGGSRVMRGGAYNSKVTSLRASARSSTSGTASYARGFRCCRKVSPKPAKCTSHSHCDDGQPCTKDSCVTSTGNCLNIHLADNTSCGKGKRCDTGRCIAIGSIGWTKVAGGTFTMGCNPKVDKECATNEKPAHAVSLSTFYMGTYPVTAAQYKICYEAGKCLLPAAVGGGANSNFDAFLPKNRQNHPVNWVSWTRAGTYCKYVGGRLCTEAEWEYAARGKDGRKYPWGNKAPTCAHANFKYYSVSPKTNPKGPTKGGSKVMRGGSYANTATYMRAGRRQSVSAGSSSYAHGIRCCK